MAWDPKSRKVSLVQLEAHEMKKLANGQELLCGFDLLEWCYAKDRYELRPTGQSAVLAIAKPDVIANKWRGHVTNDEGSQMVRNSRDDLMDAIEGRLALLRAAAGFGELRRQVGALKMRLAAKASR